MRSGIGRGRRCFLLQCAGFLAELVLFLRKLLRRLRLGLRFDGLLRRGALDLLLFLDDFGESLGKFFEPGEVFLGLFKSCEVLAEGFLGLLQRVERRLLRGRIVLLLGEGVLGLLHLIGGVAQRGGGFGRRGRGASLELLGLVLELALARRFGGKILPVGIGGVLPVGILVLDQFANFLL